MIKLFFLLLPLPVLSFSQPATEPTKLVGDTLITKTGFKIVPKTNLKIGVGSTPDGDFKYIRVSATSMFRSYSNTGYNGLANAANALPRSSSGLEYKVIRIDSRGSKKHGWVYYPIINVGMTRFEVDIENAIVTGEIDVPEQYKPKPKNSSPVVIVKNEVSIADELIKLKKLLDDGIITKDEFDAQKKKLLEKE